MNRIRITLALAALLLCAAASAQRTAPQDPLSQRDLLVSARRNRMAESSLRARFALSTNITDYMYLVTPNVDAQLALTRNLTARAGFRYNNWSFRYGTPAEMKNRNLTFSTGIRWWPWYTYSGWWLGGNLQYQEYDRGGLLMRESEAGDAFGASVSGGYSLQITPWLDLDFGLGFWGGYTLYTRYACPYCGRKTDEGGKFFALPDEARIALMFIF